MIKKFSRKTDFDVSFTAVFTAGACPVPSVINITDFPAKRSQLFLTLYRENVKNSWWNQPIQSAILMLINIAKVVIVCEELILTTSDG